ncbi:translation initiation factor IF-3, mitochondrial [Alosa pseudoharengus]|uniref:translation initiation factor IF-3, mitochondrial n=1 Tax=Alosa pseudoharengus TaxID=34774 RepID=UPI003F8CD610
MSAFRLSWVLPQVAVALRRRPCPVSPTAVVAVNHYHARQDQPPLCRFVWNLTSFISSRNTAGFSTQPTGDGENEEPPEDKPKKPKIKQDPRARQTISSVGRKIQHRRLLLLDDTGENLGTFHRADVIRMMEEKQLKLVAVNERADPPVFRLLTGKQIHEEQMKLREKMKNKSGPVQVKELTMSSDIGSGDLNTKLRQVSSWLDKKHHVRLTLRASNYSSVDDAQPLDKSLEVTLSKLGMLFGYVSPPRVIKEGRAASCVIRPPTDKEKKAAMATSASTETTAISRDTAPSTSTAKEGSVEKEMDSK